MTKAEFRIDISYFVIIRIGIRDMDFVRRWIADEIIPVMKKYCSTEHRTWDIEVLPGWDRENPNAYPEQGRNTIKITGLLVIPEDRNPEDVFDDLSRKLTTIFGSKGLKDEEEYSIQFGLVET